jgi:hypothetical protein
MENLKNIAPIEDFNWDAYENGDATTNVSKEDLEKAYDSTPNNANEYENEQDLTEKLAVHEEKIQCIVAKDGWYPNSVPFGDAQCPKLADYADGVDTMKFLLEM